MLWRLSVQRSQIHTVLSLQAPSFSGVSQLRPQSPCSAEAEDGGLLPSLQFVDEVVVSVEGSSHDVCFASWS